MSSKSILSNARRSQWAAACGGAFLVFCTTAPVNAQTCAIDLTAIAGQIQSPDIQALLTTTIDSIVAESGGLNPAAAATTIKLAQMQALLGDTGNNSDDADNRLYLTDAITLFQAEIGALKCRKGS